MTDENNDKQFYRDTESIAFTKINDRQLALLEPLGKRRTLQRGEFIFKAGQRDLGLTVILRGETEVFDPSVTSLGEQRARFSSHASNSWHHSLLPSRAG